MNLNQLSFDLNFRPALEREDFLISACNQEAVQIIDQWPNWPAPAVIIHGPEGSGKTHLSHVWQAQNNARILSLSDIKSDQFNPASIEKSDCLIIDHIDDWDLKDDQYLQETFFHLYNACKNNGASLLITSAHPLSHKTITLADLRSRLLSCPHIAIQSPDDDLLGGLLIKLFRDRQLNLTPESLNYCLSRMERSFKAAHQLVQDIDALSLAQKRRITIPLIRSIFDRDITDHIVD